VEPLAEDPSRLLNDASATLRYTLRLRDDLAAALERGDFAAAERLAIRMREEAYMAVHDLARLAAECMLRHRYPEPTTKPRGPLSTKNFHELPLGTPYWCLQVQTPIMPAPSFLYYVTAEEAQRAAAAALGAGDGTTVTVRRGTRQPDPAAKPAQ
jgi:hypothetical protein